MSGYGELDMDSSIEEDIPNGDFINCKKTIHKHNILQHLFELIFLISCILIVLIKVRFVYSTHNLQIIQERAQLTQQVVTLHLMTLVPLHLLIMTNRQSQMYLLQQLMP